MQKQQNSLVSALLLLFLFLPVHAQKVDVPNDISFLKKHFYSNIPVASERSWIYSNDTTGTKHINPAGYLLGGSLYIYQNTISKHLSADCLFAPSCSEFSKQSIREYGIIRGILASLDRVNRCNRIAEHDLKNFSHDPVSNRYSDPVSRYRKIKAH
jgi:uncharacterized protein